MLLVALVALAALGADAQSRFIPGTLTIQPRLGVTGAEFTNMPPYMDFGDVKIKAEPTGGLMVGVDLEYYFTDRVSLAGGIGFMQAGAGWQDFNYVEDGIKARMSGLKIETAYFSIPVVANWYVAPGFALKGGVLFGLLTKAELQSKSQVWVDGTTITTRIGASCKSAVNKFDVSIPVGLSYEFKFPLVIDARYNFGLTKVNKDSTPGEKDSRNGVFVLSLGYKFRL